MTAATPSSPWINSTIGYVLAASVDVVLHEGAHAVAGLAQGHPVLLRSFSAEALTAQSHQQAAVMTAAGPVFSLIFGVLILLLCRNVGDGFGRLFFLWLGCISVQNFVGYLVITPFGAGDSGNFIAELGLGTPVALLFCVIGVIGYLLLALVFMRQLSRYAENAPELRRLGLLAWLAGTAVVVIRTGIEVGVSGAGIDTAAIVMAGAAAGGVFTPIFGRAWRRLKVGDQRLVFGRPVGWLILALLVVVAQITILAPGIRLG